MPAHIRDKHGNLVPKTRVNVLHHHIRTKRLALPIIGLGAVVGAILLVVAHATTTPRTLGPVEINKIDGFTTFSQTDPAWNAYPYGSSTIGVSGCGPTSLAMIVTNLTGNVVLPTQVADYAASKGLYIPEKGTDWIIAPVVATHWGLKVQLVGADIAKINNIILAGGLVAMPGNGTLPFTPDGHYIVIRGIATDGKWKIADPYVNGPGHGYDNVAEWDPQAIIKIVEDHNGGIYGITR